MKRYFIFILLLPLFSCSDELEKITPPDVRAAEAIEELNEKLKAPSDGWKLEYQPTPASGIFQMIIDFNNDGLATINSDLADNDGQFIQQNIPYRIDNALALELIFETYGVFHYLFELEQAQFGAEFEFIFVAEEDNDLVFRSKTDFGAPTILRFTPAAPNDIDQFSIEESENMATYDILNPNILGGVEPIQQIAIPGKNTSLFWFMDVTRRNITANFVSSGITESEVIASNDKLKLSQTIGFKYSSGQIVLSQPLSFNFLGESYSIASVTLEEFTTNNVEICSGATLPYPQYTGSIEGLGNVTITKSFLNFEGLEFAPQSEQPYSINVLFAFDDEFNSLSENGILADLFPNAAGIGFNYGFDSDEQPANAMGLYVDDEDGKRSTYLREFDVVSQVGNRLEISFRDDFYFSDPPASSVEADLTAFTNLMFEGDGAVHIFDFPVDGVTVFRLFNPCNSHEFFLVQ